MPAKHTYITDRMLPGAVRKACAKRGITVTSYSDDWVLRLQNEARTEWIHVYNFSCNNSAVASNAADKVATYEILRGANLRAVPHITASTYVTKAKKTTVMNDYFASSPIVAKPLHGHGGLDLHLAADLDAAIDFVNDSPIHAWALSPYLEITKEIRVVVFADEILLSYEKTNPYTHGGLKLFNLSHGAIALTYTEDQLSEELKTLALKAVKAMGMTLAAVDIIIDEANGSSILEINSGFSLEHYSLQSEKNRQRAETIYDTIVGKIFA